MNSYLTQISALGRASLVIVALQFFVNASTFTSFPLLSVWMTNLGHNAALIATILTIVLVMTKGLPLIGGQFVDRFGGKNFLVAGLLLRFLGFLALASAETATPLIVAAVLIGLGGAAYETASYGLLAKGPDEQRKFLFLVNNQALNLGVILGPALGAGLVYFDLKLTFLASAILFLAGAIVAVLLIPGPSADEKPAVTESMFASSKKVYSNSRFMMLCLAMIPWWIIFSQLYTSFPIYYFSISQDLRNAQDIYLTNGISGLLFSIVLLKLIGNLHEMSLVQLAYLVLAAVFLVIPFAAFKMAFIAIIVIYTAAETIILPSSDSEVGKLAEKGAEATYFGAAHISWIVGGTIGNFIGTKAADSHSYDTLWMTLALIAVSGFALAKFYLRFGRADTILEKA